MVKEPLYKRPAEIAEMFSIGKSTLYYWLKNDNRFPKPIKAGKRVTLFNVWEVEEYLKNRKQSV